MEEQMSRYLVKFKYFYEYGNSWISLYRNAIMALEICGKIRTDRYTP